MTKDEALKMAIEALETAEIQSEYDGLSNLIFKAIQDCKEALEQPSVAELNDEYLRDTYVQGLSQPAQEPVAWMSGGGVLTKLKSEAQLWIIKGGTAIPLYTHPAPSWQELSDDEIDKLYADWERGQTDYSNYARAIEQALKEKNYV